MPSTYRTDLPLISGNKGPAGNDILANVGRLSEHACSVWSCTASMGESPNSNTKALGGLWFIC